MIVNAGYLQFEPKLGNLEANINRINKLLESAKEADLIVIPELANSGYNFVSKEQAFELSEEIQHSRFVDFLLEKAKRNNQHIVSGINERENGKLFNTAILVGPNGMIGKYRKIHLFMNEFDFFEPGNLGLPVFNLGSYKTGILICFDWIFPEAWRIIALQGADIICHPSNLVLPYAQQAVPVHGMINRTFNITANRIGTERNLKFSGKSIISDPFGNTISMATSGKEETCIHPLNLRLAREKKITPRNNIFSDRRPSEYKKLTK